MRQLITSAVKYTAIAATNLGIFAKWVYLPARREELARAQGSLAATSASLPPPAPTPTTDHAETHAATQPPRP